MDAAQLRELGREMGRAMVTVLMSVFDAPRAQLERAVASILAQSFCDFEFLILDDGSTAAETAQCLDSTGDPRVRILREPHRGLTATLNLGLGQARGDLIARQDADDWSEPDRLSRQTAFLGAHPDHVLAGSAAWMHQQDGTPLWPAAMPQSHRQIVDALPRGNPFFHGSVMFRREAALGIGGYRQALPCSQDYDFFWRLSEAGLAANLREPLYHYRYGASSVSATRAAEQARAHEAARRLAAQRRLGQAEDFDAVWNAAEGPSGIRAELRQADHLMLAGEYGRAGRAYRSLLRAHPENPLVWGKALRLEFFRRAPAMRPRLWSGKSLSRGALP